MAIALISHAVGHGSPTVSASPAIDTTGASLIVAHVASYDAAPGTFTDSKGNTWTALTARFISGQVRGRLFYVSNPIVGSGHTLNMTGTTSYASLALSAWSGTLTTSSPFDVESGNSGSTATPADGGTLTPANSGSLIIAALAPYYAYSTLSTSAGMTQIDNDTFNNGNNFAAHVAYLVQGAAASINPVWTAVGAGGSGYWGSSLAAFKAAPTVKAPRSTVAFQASNRASTF